MSADLLNITSRARGTRTRVVRDSETGLPLIISSQNLAPIVRDCRNRAAEADPHALRKANVSGAGMVQVAEVPFVIWNNLQKLGITKDRKALMQWLSRRDNRVFRVDDGRKLA
jgi:hypothetical protein